VSLTYALAAGGTGGHLFPAEAVARLLVASGAAVHLLTDPTSEAITSFAWSPSGSKLGLLQLRQSSDVVLITDLTGKQPH